MQVRRAVECAAGYPRAGPPEGGGDQPGQPRLAHSRRAHETQQRRRDVRLGQAHGEVVDDVLLHGAVRDMPRVEDGPGARQIRCRPAALRPRQACQALQVLAPARKLGIGRRQSRQPRQDLPPPGPHDFRQRPCIELFAETIETVRVVDARLAEKRAHLRRGDALADQRRVAGLQPQRHLPADRLQAAGELTYPPLARVAADDAPARAAGEPDRRPGQPRGPVLRADQMRLGDSDLLGLGVAGQVDDLEPVAQRRQDPRRLVGRREEQHLGQVERQIDERVAETAVLLRVEHLEQDGGRRGAELVDLVEHEDRVLAAHLPHLAQDRAGLRIPPGTVVAAQVGLVVQPAAGQLHESAPQRLGRALGQRRLSDSGGPGEADHGAGAERVPPPHGQVLDEARLGVLEAGVPGIERRAGAVEVDGRLAAPCPRQPLEPLDPAVGLLGTGVRLVRQPPALARDGLPHGRGQHADGALAEHLPHDGRGDHHRPPCSVWPPRHHELAERRQLRVQLRHARFVRVGTDHLADRIGLEAHVARARRRPPRLGGAARERARRQHLQLVRRRRFALHQHGWTVQCHGHGGRRRSRRQPRGRRSHRVVERALQQVLGDGQLLVLGVARQLDDLQPRVRALWNRAGIGHRHDPQDRGQIERRLAVRVAESGAAHRVEDVEQ